MRRRIALLGFLAVAAVVAIAVFVSITSPKDRVVPDWIRESSKGREHTGRQYTFSNHENFQTYTKAWELDKPFKEVVALLNDELSRDGWTKSKGISTNFHEWTVKDSKGRVRLKIETFEIGDHVKVVFVSTAGPSALDEFKEWMERAMTGASRKGSGEE